MLHREEVVKVLNVNNGQVILVSVNPAPRNAEQRNQIRNNNCPIDKRAENKR